jgi:putative peptidoglycan lipid II flippase
MSAKPDGGAAPGALILWLSVLTLGLGFAVQVVLAAGLGVGARMDIFVVATTVPVLVAAVAVSVFTAFLVPLLKRDDAAGGEAWALRVGGVVRAAGALGLGIALALLAGAPWVVRALAPGLDPPASAAAATLLRIMAAGCFFDVLRAALSGVEYARERFLRAQLAPSLNHAVMLLGVVVLLPALGLPGLAAAWTAGSVVMFLAVSGALRGARLVPASTSAVTTGSGSAAAELLLPVLAVAALAQLGPVVDRLVASGLGPGAISALGYGSKLLEVLLRTAPMAIGLAALPLFSARAAAGDWPGVRDALASAAHWLAVTVVPIAATVAIYRHEIVQILFERGAFDREATARVASVCGWYAAALAPAAAGYLLQSLLFALGRGWVLAAAGAAGLALTAALDVALARSVGVAGIAAAYLVVASAQSTAVYAYLRRAWPALLPGRGSPLPLRIAVGALGLLAAEAWLMPRLLPPGSAPPLLRLAACCAAGMAAYLALLIAAGDRSVPAAAGEGLSRLRRRSGREEVAP